MTPAEICRRLHLMVDELSEMPDVFWTNGYPSIHVTYQNALDRHDRVILTVGVEDGTLDGTSAIEKEEV
jgi:hypothetical protein